MSIHITLLYVFNLDSSYQLNNNFIMQALRRIPKVLEGVEDLRKDGDVETAFREYKQNVKLFIENMKA